MSMSKHLFVVGSLGVLVLLFSCTTGEPRVYTINGITESHTPVRFCGIPVHTRVEQHKTKEQRLDDIEIGEKAAEAATEAKRGTIALWIGAACLIASIGALIAAYVSKRWKTWGGIALILGGACSACWGLIEWIPHMKWILLLPASLLIYTLWRCRKFDFKEWIENRKRDNEPN